MSDFDEFINVLENEFPNGLPEYLSEDIVEDVFDEIADNCHAKVEFGVSKVAIIFDNDDCVIKIPFKGTYRESWSDDNNDYEENFEPFVYAGESGWNYCQLEADYYQEAVNAGVADYFAETAFLKEIHGYPIYVQPKVVTYCKVIYNNGETPLNSEEERHKTWKYCHDKGFSTFTLDWLTDFSNYWGQAALDKLLTFLQKMQIRDLHSENVGYLGSKPIILDYSDFNEL